MSRRSKSKNLEEARQRLKEALLTLEKAAGLQQSHIHELERDLLEAKARAHTFEDELAPLKAAHLKEKLERETAAKALKDVEIRLDEMAGEILSILQRSGS